MCLALLLPLLLTQEEENRGTTCGRKKCPTEGSTGATHQERDKQGWRKCFRWKLGNFIQETVPNSANLCQEGHRRNSSLGTTRLTFPPRPSSNNSTTPSSASSTPLPLHHSSLQPSRSSTPFFQQSLSSPPYENAVVIPGHVETDIYSSVQQLLSDNNFS